jgi:hypothetical protein
MAVEAMTFGYPFWSANEKVGRRVTLISIDRNEWPETESNRAEATSVSARRHSEGLVEPFYNQLAAKTDTI